MPPVQIGVRIDPHCRRIGFTSFKHRIGLGPLNRNICHFADPALFTIEQNDTTKSLNLLRHDRRGATFLAFCEILAISPALLRVFVVGLFPNLLVPISVISVNQW